MDKTGWFHEPDAIGMEAIWDKLHYEPKLGESIPWDFSEYTPDAVIVAIGQNDSHPEDYMKEDIDCERSCLWRNKYRKFLEKLRGQYPEAYIICCTTLLCHDRAWDVSIGRVCEEMHDKRIGHYTFHRNGKGTPGHLRIGEAEEMAEELASYMEEWIWKKDVRHVAKNVRE